MITEENRRLHREKGEQTAAKLTTVQAASQLLHTSRALPKYGIKKYNWWNESLHGVARAGIATVFPQAIAMAATFSDAILFRVAQMISTEARAKFNYSQSQGDFGIYKGLTMWSPNINIYRDPRWGRGHETYGEDPYLTSILGVAFIKGLQGDDEKYIKTSACAKHFAVHSGPEPERHTFNAKATKKDMFETYLPAFEKAVREAKVSGVMGAYNRTNGEPCCASPTLMEKLLRKEWGFDGYYVSDCGAILDIVFRHKYEKNPLKGAALALNTGCDLECGALYRLIPLACAFGYTNKETIRKSAARLIYIRSLLGMFDPECPFNKIGTEEIASSEHENFAVEVAEKGIVMLKNNGILPLKENAQKIFLTGYNSENELAYLGNYAGSPSSYIKMHEAILSCNKDTVYDQGIHLYNEKESPDPDAAIKKAENCDVIIFCTGLDSSIEGEESGGVLNGGGGNIGKQGDRITLELPEVQQQLLDKLLKLGKKIILLNFSGGCISFGKYADKVDAILQCWYPGAKGGKAIANILFGKVSPSGKLPVTFYHDIKEVPDFRDYSMENRTYKYFRGKVDYPFGYGLTYTNFELTDKNFDSEKLTLSVKVKNTGNMDSDEVLQLYVSYPQTDYRNPIKSLIAVKRFGTEAGEEKEIEFSLKESDFYSIDDRGNKVFLKGDFTLSIFDGQNISENVGVFTNTKDTEIMEKCPI